MLEGDIKYINFYEKLAHLRLNSLKGILTSDVYVK
jgi:hypothetical protein